MSYGQNGIFVFALNQDKSNGFAYYTYITYCKLYSLNHKRINLQKKT